MTEVHVDEIGRSLRYTTAEIIKASRTTTASDSDGAVDEPPS